MQIIAHCPTCGRRRILDETAADRRIKCQNCRKLFRIPKLEEMPNATEAIKTAKGAIYVDEKGKTYG
jgi:DNA-directed RNA polymerase subunit RPC12/RpoP